VVVKDLMINQLQQSNQGLEEQIVAMRKQEKTANDTIQKLSMQLANLMTGKR
jgi:hypothetical protein